LNKQSKNALKQLKVPLDPYYLYSLQLGEAAIEKGLYQPRGDALLDTVQGMYGWKPKNAQAYIEQDETGETIEIFPPSEGKPPDPTELAGAVLQTIEDKMSSPSGSGYPPSIPDYLRKG
jgi:hypothetical protein